MNPLAPFIARWLNREPERAHSIAADMQRFNWKVSAGWVVLLLWIYVQLRFFLTNALAGEYV